MWKLSLFGPPQLERDGRPVHLPRRRAVALLAYLAVTQRTHSRESLVALLWPERDSRSGRADLSRTLSVLRKALGAGHLDAGRENLALHLAGEGWVDAVQFQEVVASSRQTSMGALDDTGLTLLEGAVELCRADFLAGFTLPGCPAFDEWQLLQTEALRRELGRALHLLVDAQAARENLPHAIECARRWVELDRLHEPAQRRLMSLYAAAGQRAEAQRLFGLLQRLLVEELGVEPEQATKELYDQILSNEIEPPPPSGGVTLPRTAAPQVDESDGPRIGRPTFVGRSRELDRLQGYLKQALTGNGQVSFVCGGAGRGKTSVLNEFTRHALEGHSELIAAGGSGASFAGEGDPYLPFREVMRQLAGAVASFSPAESNDEQTRRLSALAPETAQAILEHGPELLEVFISGRSLLGSAASAATPGARWLADLRTEVAARRATPGALEQLSLFGQYTAVLRELARAHPLLITLDDLQWIDEASIGLLFHLGRRLSGSRILIVGAYRPDELSRGVEGGSESLPQLLDEFSRSFGDITLDLARTDETEGREFIDAFLDTEPNRLDEAFREALYVRTGGHPLFTVELLREMQSRGDLKQDEAGHWHAGHDLNWESTPARVEAVIARRLERLDGDSRAALDVAAVEGEVFTAEVVARVLGVETRRLLRNLSVNLGRGQRLVHERGEIQAAKGHLSSYSFNHSMFQQYLYQRLPPGERRRLHVEIAAVLADVYSEDLDSVAVRLADHYSAASAWGRAVEFRRRAGDLAYRRASMPDALLHYRAALDHWDEADVGGRAEVLRKAGECFWVLGRHREAAEALRAAYDLSQHLQDKLGASVAQRFLGRVYWEMGEAQMCARSNMLALELTEDEPESSERAWALAGMSNFRGQLEDWEESIQLGERALALARRLGDEALVVQCLCDLGSSQSGGGNWDGLLMEKESIGLALALNRPHDAGRGFLYYGEGLIYLGDYGEAKENFEECIQYANRMQIPYIATAAARMLADMEWLTGEWSSALSRLEQLSDLARAGKVAGTSGHYLALTLGRAYNDLGQTALARGVLREALDAVGDLSIRSALLGELARTHAFSGQPGAAVSSAEEILDWARAARSLFPYLNMTLLYVCALPQLASSPAIGDLARAALRQLERLDEQYHTRATSASRLEAQACVELARSEAARAAASFQSAIDGWQELKHPYDHVRALSGLARAHRALGDARAARLASAEAKALVKGLASQLAESSLKAKFLASPLVQEIGLGVATGRAM